MGDGFNLDGCASPAILDPCFDRLPAFLNGLSPVGYHVLRLSAGTIVLPEGFVVMDSYSTPFPLPKSWPQNVKTAVLHVISLAHVAIVHARSIVVCSPNPRTRLVGDLRGSLDEISLLEEEFRIKDALGDDRRSPAPALSADRTNGESRTEVRKRLVSSREGKTPSRKAHDHRVVAQTALSFPAITDSS